MFDSLVYALDVTLPISLIIGLGILLKRIGWITDDFAKTGSDLVFNLTLPCLLFVNIATTNLTDHFPTFLIVFAASVMTVAFIIFHFIAYGIANKFSRGAFVQGACRGNMAIIGLALSVNAFGESALAIASMYLAVLVVPLNIFSILTLYYHQEKTPSIQEVTRSVFTNPLAIAISLAIMAALLPIQLPSLLLDTGNYLASMTLPLALLCVGATIRWQEFRSSRLLYWAISSKIVFIPFVATGLGFYFGLRGDELGVLFMMTAAPTAAAAYPMVRSIGGDYHLTAAIIAGSTFMSIVSSTLGLFLLRQMQWV
ncbi:AEC family transporter [Paraglaciecola psychrophila]|uniref:Auxin efflux carrier family protein n=1 Tax=Paraglaciecola psychrophila 170 TaxID=1129794 RepID=K6YYA8_9ALTE|nr:AEC family transporter [Paraglaciecola psychrophila]AGH46043.1 auxin efflux carrier family protein [Paraglaciecola psychrophila 170]GAC37719.1 auxin efflux carrier [Paraglaciecola psychrophila 170]